MWIESWFIGIYANFNIVGVSSFPPNMTHRNQKPSCNRGFSDIWEWDSMGYCGIIGYSIYNQDYDKELVMHLWGCYSFFLPCISNKLAQKNNWGKGRLGELPNPQWACPRTPTQSGECLQSCLSSAMLWAEPPDKMGDQCWLLSVPWV